LSLEGPPTEAAEYSVRFTTSEEGSIVEVTNRLGWVLTMQPAIPPPLGSQQIILPGLTTTNLFVEAASQTETNCDGRWLWQPIPGYTVTVQPDSVIVTLPNSPEQTRIHRVRPAP
jgi:hypothetical protein